MQPAPLSGSTYLIASIDEEDTEVNYDSIFDNHNTENENLYMKITEDFDYEIHSSKSTYGVESELPFPLPDPFQVDEVRSPDLNLKKKSKPEILVFDAKIEVPEENSKFENLGQLFEVLIAIFGLEEPGSKSFVLSDVEKYILLLILRRKMGAKNVLSSFFSGPEVSPQLILSQLEVSKSKRSEEYHKFIFSRGLKHLQNSFNIRNRMLEKTNQAFYEYYFKDVIAKDSSLTLSDFFNPNSIRISSVTNKINRKYYFLLFRSERFTKDFGAFIREHLVEEYKVEIRKKLEILLKKWDSKNPNLISVSRISEYLLANKKCKLPWRLDEVRRSVKSFIELIECGSPGGWQGEVLRGDKK